MYTGQYNGMQTVEHNEPRVSLCSTYGIIIYDILSLYPNT